MTRPIALLTDYGAGSEHVGALHALLARETPGGERIDLAHELPAGRVRWAAIILARQVRLLPAGSVALAVVDPAVGTDRRALAVRTAGGIDLVGPDNGLLAPAIEGLGGASAAVELAVPPDAPATFHGRDLFAPAAASLAAGAALEDLGSPVDPAGIESLPLPAPVVEEGAVSTEVVAWDRFGNVATLATGDALERAGLGLEQIVLVESGASRHGAVIHRAFGEVPPGDMMVYVDSHGWVAIAINGGDAAELLGAEEGMTLRISQGRRAAAA